VPRRKGIANFAISSLAYESLVLSREKICANPGNLRLSQLHSKLHGRELIESFLASRRSEWAGTGLIAGPLRPEGLLRQAFEGKFPKALIESRRSRADGPAFLSPARKGWVFCSGGSCGLKVRDRAKAGPHATPPPIPSLQAGVPFDFPPSPLGWANESHTGGAQNAVRRKEHNNQRQQRLQL